MQDRVVTMEDQRTDQQRKAIQVFCRNLAGELNGKGKYMQLVLKPTYELRWDMDAVKEHLYKPIAKALYGVESTTQLDTSQISKVHEQLMLMLVEKFPEVDYVDFPSEDSTPEYLESFAKPKSELSLADKIMRYMKANPGIWIAGQTIADLAHALPEKYKHSTVERRNRELHEAGLLLRKEDKSPKGRIKTVFYKYDNTN